MDILRANNQISAQQYTQLLRKARTEEEARQIVDQRTQEAPNTFRLHWKEGMRLDMCDDIPFKFKFGGRIQNDWALFDTDDDIEAAFWELGSGTEFRQARFYMSGTLYDVVKFKARDDFAGGGAELKDAYLQLTKLPLVSNFSVGRFKEPFSLEEITSSKYITFMERALPNVFAPGRNSGMMVHGHAFDERLTWAVGTFRQTDDLGTGFGADSKYNVTMRVTGLP